MTKPDEERKKNIWKALTVHRGLDPDSYLTGKIAQTIYNNYPVKVERFKKSRSKKTHKNPNKKHKRK